MKLFDTARREVVPFEPGPLVKIYVCGITPYDATHIGHAATYVLYDVLQRRLVDRGHEVLLVRNITDVDDDILNAARERGVHHLDLAFNEVRRFREDMAALGVMKPWSEPRASSAIADIRGIITTALQRGLAYQSGGSVYFDSRSVEDFGTLSGLDEASMIERSRAWRDNPDDSNKRHPLDFVLWRPSAPGEPAWEARWGSGRPGWHVECSALVRRELGPTIDLHGGGLDLLYPHHECERIQSESVNDAPFVKHWLHQAMVSLDGIKMSKSIGNLVFVHELRRRFDPLAIRLALLERHYRTSWDWSEVDLGEATSRLAVWKATVGADKESPEALELLETVRGHIDDDLDTPSALSAIDQGARANVNIVLAAELLGLM